MSRRLEMLENLLATGQADSFARYALAMEYRKLGRTDEALAVFGELRQRDPGYLPMYQMAAALLRELTRTEEARSWLEAGIVLAGRVGNSKTRAELELVLAELSD